MHIKSYAKINPFLDVLGKRPDGYHDLRTVMQSIDLHDDLFIKTSGGLGEFALSASGNGAPQGEENLVWRAASIMAKEYNINEAFEMRLVKRIPMGAGLAGGSSNCAAALLGIRRLFGLEIPEGELASIAKSLGADVPFCLAGGTCLAEGVGERLTRLAPHPECIIVVAHPRLAVSTEKAFKSFCAEARKPNDAGLSEFLSAICHNDLTKAALCLYNVFTDLTAGEYPVVRQLIETLEQSGALGASMSGTGSAVFGYFSCERAASKARQQLSGAAETFVTKPVQAANHMEVAQ